MHPYSEVGRSIAHHPDWRGALNERAREIGLCTKTECPVHFVPQEVLPAEMAYEAFIAQTGNVPTRDNLHDFFNALVWLHFPKTKAKLNALQFSEIQAGLLKPTSRGKLRDAATIFDENAALVMASDASIIEDLREHAWRKVFVEDRSSFEKLWKVHVFGHALMEKLQSPFKAITAHAWALQGDFSSAQWRAGEQQVGLDDIVATSLDASMNTRSFSPLPVAGIPGWWNQQDEVFYSDISVFRPKRK
jgi:hypothetical protein